MKRLLLQPMILLALCVPAIAEVPKSLQLPPDTPTPSDPAKRWPQKGDTVYVSARLVGADSMMLIVSGYGGQMPGVPTLEPCEPVTAKKVAAEDGTTIIKDDMGNTRKLEGGWLTRMHRTEAECRATIKEMGAPRVKSVGGYRYTLVLDQPAPPPPASPETSPSGGRPAHR